MGRAGVAFFERLDLCIVPGCCVWDAFGKMRAFGRSRAEPTHFFFVLLLFYFSYFFSFLVIYFFFPPGL